MQKRYNEYKKLNLPEIGEEIRKFWEEEDIFKASLDNSKDGEPYVFYEGPPSANGKPGIHHVMARAIKDLFCRYKTLKGYHVNRKGGWDTHGLPVEISVEKTLGISKEDIGKTITVEDYNLACRKEVMKYKDQWDELTKMMGYWVDLDDPYITFDNKYIESVWNLLYRLYDKGLLYKGYTIQPYSPAAGTGLSTHELNQPGCYRDVKDTTVVGQFEVIRDEKSEFLFESDDEQLYFLAWTTTPWTLPSNTALAVGKGIKYVKVKSYNQYSGKPISVVLASDLVNKWFDPKNAELEMGEYEAGSKKIPFEVAADYTGDKLEGIRYEQLIPWIKPDGDAFRVIIGDYVTTEDGTGIVHIAPTFGADDDRVAKQSGIVPLILIDNEGTRQPMVDKTGKFYKLEDLDAEFVKNFARDSYTEFNGRYVKNDYDKNADKDSPILDVDIAVMLKLNDKAFRIEKYVHNYPHCWRTDKPILYYPLDSWFIKTTEVKEKMIALNNDINWKPAWTGEGRFGEWLKNLVDWNLSRSRFWGVPLPIWTTEDRKEQICIGSAEQLKAEVEKSMEAGFMTENPMENFKVGDMSKENYETFDFHRPYADNIVLVSESGKKMFREPDLIDVWFDSGSMPYAQLHYPFENKEFFEKNFPADFIAEGVDQTRGWFFTMHAIAAMLFDSVSYKTCLSNGLVLDKNGNKMSKRLGNAVDPFETINQYGPDATRWYMITNAQPWDNLKFDLSGVAEVQRKFFGTLYNTYSFFALYANIDGFDFSREEIPVEKRPEIDRWIISELNTLIKKVDEAYDAYEPTRAGRLVQQFVDEHLSNWYVRLCRRRFWKGEMSDDKLAAYQTLYTCLITINKLASPIAPFFTDRMFKDLNSVTNKENAESVHLSDFPEVNESYIDSTLEQQMQMAQKISSMVLSLRKKSAIRVRQPLNKIMVPVLDASIQQQIEHVKDLILNEVNIKDIEFLTKTEGILVKKIKPNFKTLGPKFGKLMKQIAAQVTSMNQEDISKFESEGKFSFDIDGTEVVLDSQDAEVQTEDIPGWVVATEGKLTVALDVTITEELANEGLARDFVNRIQNLRKEKNFDVTDKIALVVDKNESVITAIEAKYSYICSETLTESLKFEDLNSDETDVLELNDELSIKVKIQKQ